MSNSKGRNKGHDYEDKIKVFLKSSNLLPDNLGNNDAGFIHRNKVYFLEVKSKKTSDFGASKIIWNPTDKRWLWNEPDVINQMLDEIKVLNYINKNFTPYKHTIPDKKIDKTKKEFDQKQFETKIPLFDNANFIYDYYAQKDCFYIQVEGKGFYFLKEDIAKLGVPQFNPLLNYIRLRAKTHHSEPESDYSFRAEIQAKRRSLKISNFDIEEVVGKFPPIK